MMRTQAERWKAIKKGPHETVADMKARKKLAEGFEAAARELEDLDSANPHDWM